MTAKGGPRREQPGEQRRQQRRQIDIKVTISIAGNVVPARTRDISRSGVCLISDSEIPRDTELKIKLVLSMGAEAMSEPLVLTGQTIWCTAIAGKFQIGAMFVQVDTERRRFLDLFLKFVDGEVSPAGHRPAAEDVDREAAEAPTEDKDDPFRP